MTVLSVASGEFFSQGVRITPAGIDIQDQLLIQLIRYDADARGVTLLLDAVVPPALANGGVPEPTMYEYTWDQDIPIIVSAPTNISVVGGGSIQRYGIIYNLGAALNVDWRWMVPVSKGTWRLQVLADKDPSRAIQTWDISYDGGQTWAPIGQNDQSGTAATNQRWSQNFTVPATGLALLRLRNPTKNAAGGNYITIGFLRMDRVA